MIEHIMSEYLLHMVAQFDPDSVKTELYVVAPLLLAVGALLIGALAPYIALGLGALLGGTSASTVLSGIGLATGIAEFGMVSGGIGTYSAMGETMSRAFEVALQREMMSVLNAGYPSVSQSGYPLPQQWQTYDRYLEPKLPIRLNWIPKIDLDHPMWRNFSIEELAHKFGVDSNTLKQMLGL